MIGLKQLCDYHGTSKQSALFQHSIVTILKEYSRQDGKKNFARRTQKCKTNAERDKANYTYIDRKGRGWRDFFENWPNFDHIKTCFVYGGGVMQGQRAGQVFWQVKCREPKTGRQKIQLHYMVTFHFANRGILFIYAAISCRILWITIHFWDINYNELLIQDTMQFQSELLTQDAGYRIQVLVTEYQYKMSS